MQNDELKELALKPNEEILSFLLQNQDKEEKVLHFMKNNMAYKQKYFAVASLLKDSKQNNKGIGALKAEIINEANKNSYQEIEVDLLENNPYQPRLQIEQESLIELSNSIKKDGLQSPIKITPIENGKFIIVYGHRRVEAHRYLGLPKIKCFIEEVDENKLRRLALVENLQREDLSLIEKALSYANALNSGDFSTQKELAEELGLKRTKVSEIMSLLNLDGNIIYDLKKDKSIKDTTALSLINKIEKDSQWEIYSLLKKGEIDREGIRKYLNNGIEKTNSQCESKLKNNKLQLFYKINIKEKEKQKAFKEFIERETKNFLDMLRDKEAEFRGTTN